MKRILSILVLILLISSLSGCKGAKTLATDNEIENLFEMLEEYFNENDYSYKFTTTHSYKEKTKEGSEIIKQTTKGVVTYDYEDGFYSKSYEASGKITEKSVKPTLKGKEKEKTTINESVVYLSAAHRNKAESICYIDRDLTYKNAEGKTTSNIKTTLSSSTRLSIVSVTSFIDDICRESNYFYVKGNQYKVVVSGSDYIKEYIVVFDGNDIKSITYIYESHYAKTTTKVKFVDYQKIEKPKNASDYETE